MQASEQLIISLISRMENGFGRLEEGQKQNRMSSEQRTKELHKRIDKVEEKLEKHQQPKPSPTSYLKVVGSLLAHWQILLTVLFVLVGISLGKSPDTIKVWVGALK